MASRDAGHLAFHGVLHRNSWLPPVRKAIAVE
jgi:hypothetical protein